MPDYDPNKINIETMESVNDGRICYYAANIGDTDEMLFSGYYQGFLYRVANESTPPDADVIPGDLAINEYVLQDGDKVTIYFGVPQATDYSVVSEKFIADNGDGTSGVMLYIKGEKYDANWQLTGFQPVATDLTGNVVLQSGANVYYNDYYVDSSGEAAFFVVDNAYLNDAVVYVQPVMSDPGEFSPGDNARDMLVTPSWQYDLNSIPDLQ